MKSKIIIITLILFAALLVGCGKKNTSGENTTTTPAPTQAAATTAPTPTTVAVATAVPTTAATTAPTNAASTVKVDVVPGDAVFDTEAAFLTAISKDGNWIIAISKDLTINQDLLLEGEFKNGSKDTSGKEIIQRKLALYSADANNTLTASYILTAPKLTVTSPNASIDHGTFKGDLYIDVDNFQLIDATIEGNVVFTKKQYQDSFKMDDASKITGTQTVQ